MGVAIPLIAMAAAGYASAKGLQAVMGSPKPPGGPTVPDPSDAANAALQQTDAMRARRGLLSNIYAGGQAAAAPPTFGKTKLGT